MSKTARFRKTALRLTLQTNMRQTVSPMEFARWLKYYCELHHLPDEINRAKTLDESVVNDFSAWLGYPLR